MLLGFFFRNEFGYRKKLKLYINKDYLNRFY